jgi:Tol biopolymer transport system component
MASPPTSGDSRPPHDRLESWKEIATFLRRDITTVQRWEKRESMPVHRHQHDKAGSVYAFRSELDAWVHRRKAPVAAESEAPSLPRAPTMATPVRRSGYWLAAVAALVTLGAVVAGFTWWTAHHDLAASRETAEPRVESVTDFDGVEQAASISLDGRLAAFLSDRDGRTDVWVTQLGSGQFHNLTNGSAPELSNPSVRTLGFTPDGESVTYWVRRPGEHGASDIGIWSVSVLGGPPSPYLSGAAELAWAPDGSRLAYHTTSAGDPLFVTSDPEHLPGTPIYAAPAGLHAHFPLWSPDGAFLYFVQGSLPDKMDIWRMTPTGAAVERLTTHNGRVSYPVFTDRTTIAYLASDADGLGPWLYQLDVQTRVSHRLLAGADTYTSLAAAADGRRLVVTAAHSKRTLWRLPLGDVCDRDQKPSRVDLSVGNGFSPRLGAGYLLHVSSVGGHDQLWKIAGDTSQELWRTVDAQIVGAPAISPDGQRIAFSARVGGRTALYVMRADGSDVRAVTDALSLTGAPAWTSDGLFITSAADDHGTPKLVNIPLDGSPPVSVVAGYSSDPSWSPDGKILVYSGPDIGTTFSLKSMAFSETAGKLIPSLTLTRGARHVVFLPQRHALVVLRGEIQHKDLWAIDLNTGHEEALSCVDSDFNMTDFDISPDGRDVVLERSQGSSHIVLIEFPHRRP